MRQEERTMKEGWSQTVEQEIQRRMLDTVERTCAVEIRARRSAEAEARAQAEQAERAAEEVRAAKWEQ
jgi:hypothetical protein